MRASVRSFESVDIDVDSYRSESPECDGQWVRMYVGPADGPGDESFDVLVCTPQWLQAQIESDGPQIGRHRLIVFPFELREAMAFLQRRVEQLEAPDWSQLGAKIGRLGYWEFEDYTD